ncbi:hypothetical protein, partial [Microbacterium sp. 22296]|uniref:hypothetical protein n=1 Tax=Microbacterium sp. 22296 TaxID=3453903 RepID=UPI003F82D5DD
MPQPPAASTSAYALSRGLTLRGDLAARWSALRGWTVRPLDEAGVIRLHVDELRTPSLTLRRLWHTAAALEPASPETNGPVVILQAA